MKKTLVGLIALGFVLSMFVLAVVAARAQGIDQKIQALEEELQRLKSEQAQVKTEQLEMKKQAGLAVTASEVGSGIRRLSFAGIASVQAPLPVQNLGHVLAVLVDVLRVLDPLVADRLLSVSGSGAKLRHAVDDVAHEERPMQYGYRR